MNWSVLSTASRLLFPLMLLFAIFAFTRGHNAPGGGFIGGLVAVAATALYVVANGVAAARRLLGVDPRNILAAGLLVAASSGLVALVRGQPLMTGQWMKLSLGGNALDLGTPLLFDLGVALVVFGGTVLVVFSLAEE